MPKQFKKYEAFHGGLNSHADPRDIAENEVSDIVNMVVDEVGKIRSMGKLVAPTGITATEAVAAVKGYGLFVFGADYDMASNGANDSATTNNGGQAVFNDTAHGLDDDDIVFHWDYAEATYNGYKVVDNKTANTYETGDAFVDASQGNWIEVSQATNASEKYLAVADAGAAAAVSIMPVSDDIFAKAMIDLGTTTGAKMVFYYVDGALRVCDANFGSGNTTKWFGYINRDQYQHIGAAALRVYAWYARSNIIAPPTAGIVSEGISGTGAAGSGNVTIVDATLEDYSATGDEYVALHTASAKAREITVQGAAPFNLTTTALGGADTWLANAYVIFNPVEDGLCVYAVTSAAAGSWEAQTLEFGCTYLYDGHQESLVLQMKGTLAVIANDSVVLDVFALVPYDERIEGMRVYCREEDSNDDWLLVIDIDLRRNFNVRMNLTEPFYNRLNAYGGAITGDGGNAPDEYYTSTPATMEHLSKPSLSYNAINGFSSAETSLYAEYKTATVLNRRTWIANVKAENESGTSVIYGDRIMYSPIGKFDTFPTSFYLDVGINDGDEFTALQGYADRILAFKSERMFIINVAQGSDTGWFLESPHEHLGVEIPAATFKTDFGIIWVNKNGCFLYDGSSIRNLIERDKRKLIKPTTWETFITADAIIGFDPIRKQIIVVGDCDATAGNTYLCDLATLSWAKGTRFKQDSNHKYTNFAIHENELIIGAYSD